MTAYVEKHEPERTFSFRTKFYNMTPPNKKMVIASIFICKFFFFKKKTFKKNIPYTNIGFQVFIKK